MSLPFVGEIRPLPYTFAPNGWLFCEGQIINIADNETLFSLIGTTFGGDGQNTFALPDLRGRVPIGSSSEFVLGDLGGKESVPLNASQMPSHQHSLNAAGAASSYSPVDTVPGVASHPTYGQATGAKLAADAVSTTGSGAAHENRQPFLAMGFAISLYGVYPSKN